MQVGDRQTATSINPVAAQLSSHWGKPNGKVCGECCCSGAIKIIDDPWSDLRRDIRDSRSAGGSRCCW